jgi:hypothetical protein
MLERMRHIFGDYKTFIVLIALFIVVVMVLISQGSIMRQTLDATLEQPVSVREIYNLLEEYLQRLELVFMQNIGATLPVQ